MKLADSLGTLPSGKIISLSVDQLTKELRERYLFDEHEKARRKLAEERIDLYKDRGRALVEKMIDEIFKNQITRRMRREFVKHAMFQNVTKRIVREISTVYSETATRTVSTGNQRYSELQRETRADRKMRLLNRRVNLLNESLLWFDVVGGTPVIRVVTPNNFFAVHHPNDPLHAVAYVIAQAPRGVNTHQNQPHWLVMSDTEFFKLDGDGRYVKETHYEHGLGLIPALLAHREEPDESLLDMAPGSDLVAAHMSVALLNTMMLKHQKSGTKMAYATGDLSTTPTDQPMDEEVVLQLGEGTSMNTLDLGADPANYINSARAVIKQVAANYGIPESVFDMSYQATSGFEISLKRIGLREVRRDQILDFRPLERDFASIQERVLANSRHPLSFSASGWGIDFGEVETPVDPMQMLVVWEKQRQMGLKSTLDMIMYMNPEMNRRQAEALLEENALIEAARIMRQRELNISPSNNTTDPGNTAEENGGLRLVDEDDDSEGLAG